jgi:hypothetical protein
MQQQDSKNPKSPERRIRCVAVTTPCDTLKPLPPSRAHWHNSNGAE